MSDGIVTINGHTMIQVLPRCKKTKDGRPMCGFCGESAGLRFVYSSAHDATLVTCCCGIVQFVHRGLVQSREVTDIVGTTSKS